MVLEERLRTRTYPELAMGTRAFDLQEKAFVSVQELLSYCSRVLCTTDFTTSLESGARDANTKTRQNNSG